MSHIKITMDRSKLDEFSRVFLQRTGVKQIVYGITDAVRGRWIELASARLSSSRGPYISAIQATKLQGTIGVIELVGAFANLVEHGTPGFDMRDTLLRPQGLTSRVIPFRHLGPDAAGASGVGAPMGKPYAKTLGVKPSRALGQAIYAVAKGLSPGESLRPGSAPLLHSHHKSDIYAGLQRQPQKSGSRYMTFRTISEDGDPDSWMYPALTGRNVTRELEQELPDIANSVLSAVLDQLTGG